MNYLRSLPSWIIFSKSLAALALALTSGLPIVVKEVDYERLIGEKLRIRIKTNDEEKR